jgi:hypothetical protein
MAHAGPLILSLSKDRSAQRSLIDVTAMAKYGMPRIP